MIEMSTNERLRILLGAERKEAKPNCRLIPSQEMSGIEVKQLQDEIREQGAKK